jgi:hypothetical protein
MKPAIQASNIQFCNIRSISATINWDNGDGDRRIVVITPEKIIVDTTSTEGGGSTSSFGDNGYNSTPENPDPNEVRQYFPGHYPASYYETDDDNGTSCSSTTYLAPDESLPIDGDIYRPSIFYGEGDQLFITSRGVTSSDPTLCPNPSPSPSPQPEYELITATSSQNGAYVVYEGTASQTTVLGLDPEKGYYVSVFEFNEECIEYLVEANSRSFVTSCKQETSIITLNVTDCRTCRPIVAMVEIYNKSGALVDIGSTDQCGLYKSSDLETCQGYKVKVIAPNYDEYIIRNAYIKERPDPTRSDLHPNWSQGTRLIPTYTTPPSSERDNCYDVKL